MQKAWLKEERDLTIAATLKVAETNEATTRQLGGYWYVNRDNDHAFN